MERVDVDLTISSGSSGSSGRLVDPSNDDACGLLRGEAYLRIMKKPLVLRFGVYVYMCASFLPHFTTD